ncbi:MAG: hypothetical protein NT011_02270 [Kiritimatiellaeota bacterium]|nr:hypothetical protein [Kiritimatiellota bacterium]
MLKSDIHKRAMAKLENLIDLDYVTEVEARHIALWEGKPFDRLPCIVDMPTPNDWPTYPFTECWDDIEKNFMTCMGNVYSGALLRDDRTYHIEPEYGVVNIPELLQVPSVVTNEGNSMSEGLNDANKIRELVARGIPSFDSRLNRKVEAFEDFARTVLNQYKKLSQCVHLNVPNLQGPFDLACLVWGREIMTGLYDEPKLVEDLLDLVTDTYIQYGIYHKRRIGAPMDSAWHAAGVRLVHGGVRICNDSAVLVSGEVYRSLIKSRDLRAFAPFHGGWVHYCGNGNHFVNDLLDMEPVHYLHLGNPDMHDILALARKIAGKDKVLVWSGSLDKIREACEITGYTRILALPENRYGGKNLDDAKDRLARARKFQAIKAATW